MNGEDFTRRTTTRKAVATAVQCCVAPLFCVLTAFPATATAAGNSGENLTDMSLEQLLQVPVVYGASKYEQKVTRAPASVSIVTADEIRRYGYRTLAEVMQSMRGVYASNDRNYTYLGTRGFLRPGDYNSRVLMLIDGHRMNENLYSMAFVGREGMIDVNAIERVEFVRGPSSSIYGSNAFFGIINIVTKRPGDAQGLELSGNLGTFNSHEGRVSYANRFENNTGAVLTGSYYSSDGDGNLYYPEFDPRISSNPRATNNGFAQGIDDERAYNIHGSVNHGKLTLSALYTSRDKIVPTASFDTLFNDTGMRTSDTRGYIDFKYEHSFSSGWSMLGRTAYDRYDYTGGYPSDYAPDGEPLLRGFFRDEARGDWVGTEWQLTGRLNDRHAIVTGVEYRHNLEQKQVSYDDLDPRVSWIDSNEHSGEAGIFVQDEYSLSSRLILNAGVRYDHYFEGFGGTWNPRLGLIYNPRESSTFKLLYGQAFRAPTAFERFYYLGVQTLSELEPETIRTYELAYEQILDRRHRLNVSVYHYRIKDLITQIADSDGEPYYANLSHARAKGVEVEAEGFYDSGLQARMSYTLQRAQNSDNGIELTGSPRHLARVNVLVPVIGEKLMLGSELQFQSAMHTLAGSHSNSFWLGNLTLSSRWPAQGVELAAGVYNVLDERYANPGAEEHLQDVIEQDGRTYRLQVAKQFGAR